MQGSCKILRINRRRVVRWQSVLRRGQNLGNAKPGSLKPPHRLLEEERLKIIEAAKKTEYADFSHRILTVTAWEQNMFFVSFSTVYRVLCSEGLMSQRGHQQQHNGRSIAPYRRPLSGPNQRWCWDISYLHTYEKGLYLFLYLLLDEYSRRAISWIVSWRQDSETAHRLLDDGLVRENILDLAEEERPEIFNDRLAVRLRLNPYEGFLRIMPCPRFSQDREPPMTIRLSNELLVLRNVFINILAGFLISKMLRGISLSIFVGTMNLIIIRELILLLRSRHMPGCGNKLLPRGGKNLIDSADIVRK